MPEREVSSQRRPEDTVEVGLRPKRLGTYVGQDKVKDNLHIAIAAAQQRGDALDHILLYGPPGLGKTTLAYIIAAEMGVNIRLTAGPAIERAGDMAAILTNLKKHDVLFIDEMHRLGRVVEEILYPAMEDFALDIVIGKGPSARNIRLTIPPFTLIGATTRYAMMSPPLRDRFGAVYRLDFYDQTSLETIVTRSAQALGVDVDPGAVTEIAQRARGTPRVANRLLRRVRDYAQVVANGKGSRTVAMEALARMEVDSLGLDQMDRRVLETIVQKFDGGPVGLDTIAMSISEDADTIMDVYEPYMLQIGFIGRTPRGRIATRRGYEYLGVAYKKGPDSDAAAQSTFWDSERPPVNV